MESRGPVDSRLAILFLLKGASIVQCIDLEKVTHILTVFVEVPDAIIPTAMHSPIKCRVSRCAGIEPKIENLIGTSTLPSTIEIESILSPVIAVQERFSLQYLNVSLEFVFGWIEFSKLGICARLHWNVELFI